MRVGERMRESEREKIERVCEDGREREREI